MPWQRLTRKKVCDRLPVVSITPRGDVYLNRSAVKLATSHIGPVVGQRFSILVDTGRGMAILAPDEMGWTASIRTSGAVVLTRAMSRQAPKISHGLYLATVVYMDDLPTIGKVLAFGYTIEGEKVLAEAAGEIEKGGEPITIVPLARLSSP